MEFTAAVLTPGFLTSTFAVIPNGRVSLRRFLRMACPSRRLKSENECLLLTSIPQTEGFWAEWKLNSHFVKAVSSERIEHPFNNKMIDVNIRSLFNEIEELI